MMMNLQLSSDEFAAMLDEDEDTNLMSQATERIAFAMEDADIDMATALIVAARDYISAYYNDEEMGYKICKIVSQGKE